MNLNCVIFKWKKWIYVIADDDEIVIFSFDVWSAMRKLEKSYRHFNKSWTFKRWQRTIGFHAQKISKKQIIDNFTNPYEKFAQISANFDQ